MKWNGLQGNKVTQIFFCVRWPSGFHYLVLKEEFIQRTTKWKQCVFCVCQPNIGWKDHFAPLSSGDHGKVKWRESGKTEVEHWEVMVIGTRGKEHSTFSLRSFPHSAKLYFILQVQTLLACSQALDGWARMHDSYPRCSEEHRLWDRRVCAPESAHSLSGFIWFSFSQAVLYIGRQTLSKSLLSFFEWRKMSNLHTSADSSL